jgi:hypothetical protein
VASSDDDTLTRWPGQRTPLPSRIIATPRSLLAELSHPPNAEHAGEPETQAPAKKSDPLPRPGDPYRAHARFLNHMANAARMIHFVRGDFTCEGFCYSDLRRLRWLPASEPGSGPVLLLRFVEAEITEVRIEGRHLEDIHHWIGEGVMPWVWEQPAGIRARNDAAVITRITLGGAEQ